MSPVLSTMSGMSARGFGWPYSQAASAFELIETQTVGAGGQASITFSSILQTYKHLEIRGTIRNSGNSNNTYVLNVRCNADTGNNYSTHYLRGPGANPAVSGAATSTSAGYAGVSVDSSTAALGWGGFVMQILDYTSTSKNKTLRSLAGVDTNGGGVIDFYSTAWLNSSTAITSLTFLFSANNLSQFSSISLFGIK